MCSFSYLSLLLTVFLSFFFLVSFISLFFYFFYLFVCLFLSFFVGFISPFLSFLSSFLSFKILFSCLLFFLSFFLAFFPNAFQVSIFNNVWHLLTHKAQIILNLSSKFNFNQQDNICHRFYTTIVHFLPFSFFLSSQINSISSTSPNVAILTRGNHCSASNLGQTIRHLLSDRLQISAFVCIKLFFDSTTAAVTCLSFSSFLLHFSFRFLLVCFVYFLLFWQDYST